MGSTPENNNNNNKDGDQQRRNFAHAFERAVGRARWFGFVERGWERAVPTIGGLSGVFLSASWFGLWQNSGASVRVAGFSLFAAALVSAIRPLLKVRRLSRDEALDRMDQASGLEGRPASTYDDIPADENRMDDETKALWQAQRRFIEKDVKKFKAGALHSRLKQHDPFALRFALILLTGLSFAYAAAQNQEVERITSVFDWGLQSPVRSPVQVDARVSPPDYTGVKPFSLSKTNKNAAGASEKSFTVPARSLLTIHVHDKDAEISVKGGGLSVEEACISSARSDITRCEFELTGRTAITIKRGKYKSLSWRFNVTPDLPPKISVAPAAPEKHDPKQQRLTLSYSLEDDYDAEVTEGRIIPAKPDDSEARPLPLYSLPMIKVPVK